MKTIPSSLALLAAVGLIATGALPQAQGGLLYTTLVNEASPQCGAILNAVNQVLDEEVQYLYPTAAAAPMSMAFAPQVGYCELLGDHDADGNYWEVSLFGKTDALVRPRGTGGVIPQVDMHTLFISTLNRMVNAAGAVFITPGDVFRIVPGGMIEFFITEAQVKAAFGIPANTNVNVDAAAMSSEPGGYGVLVSFENDVTTGLFPIRDGDILRIPAVALTFAPSPYDGCLLVATVAPNSGGVLYPEAAVDAMCVASGVGDLTGAPVPLVIDVDGLTWNHPYTDLWFSGQGLQGGSVLTDLGGGAIAALNGVALGSLAPAPTTGTQVGLIPPVRSLNGLALALEACPFVTDTLTPSGPGMLTIEAAGLPPGALCWFLLNLLPDGPVADASTAFPNPCFPQLYPFMTFVGPNIVGATGCTSFTGGPVPPLPGWHITAQGLSITAAWALPLSTPTVFDL